MTRRARCMSTATITLDPLRHFEGVSTISSVDSEKGVIYGVSLITSGISARGHQIDHPADKDEPEALRRKINLEIDKTTLEQMLSCAEEKKKLPVKWNHKTGADAVSGYLKNFRIEGNKLLGDWHLLKSHERYRHALELATEMPESLGLSTSFRGKDEHSNGRAFARCTDLVSADLVASPAANPDGFFEEVDSTGESMATQPTDSGADHDLNEPSLADVLAGIHALNSRFESVENEIASFKEFQDAVLNQEFEEEEQLQDEINEFSNGEEALQFLAEKLSNIEDAKEQAKVERAFAAYDSKVEALVELNEQLAMENSAMAEAITEFTDATGAEVQFSAAPDGGSYEHSFSGLDDDRRAPRTEFEARCRQLEAEGKDEHEAVRFAIKENTGRYQRHLQEQGIMARNL